MELSAEELDNIAGGAIREAQAATTELIDVNGSILEADRKGVRSSNFQFTNKFTAFIVENEQTGS
jgi:hypothetical protein